MRFTLVPMTVFSLSALAGFSLAAADSVSSRAGMVYTMTNAASDNAVIALSRASGGALTPEGSFPTGGMGTGASLGSAGSVVLSHDQQWLFAVNAGSDQLSVFAVTPRGLKLSTTTSTGGIMPVSVTSNRGLVYVVHSGSDNIAGFRLSAAGALTPIPQSMQPLSGTGVGPAQVAFDPDGDVLVVTEKNTNLITTFVVGNGGVAMPGQSQPSAGMEPFGFAFSQRGQLFVSEAFGGAPDGSALSSYRLDDSGRLQTIAASVKTNQTAACWAITDAGGRFAFVANTGSNSLSSYLVEFNGQMALFQSQAAKTGASPADLALSSDGRLLYVLNGDGSITGNAVRIDGILVGFTSGITGLPTGSVGLAAW